MPHFVQYPFPEGEPWAVSVFFLFCFGVFVGLFLAEKVAGGDQPSSPEHRAGEAVERLGLGSRI